jgi:hypothetical protein
MPSKTLVRNGVVRGTTIELSEDSGLRDGQKVRVTVQVIDENHVPDEGLRRAFGAWADDSEGLDEYLEWNRQQRKINRPEIDP